MTCSMASAADGTMMRGTDAFLNFPDSAAGVVIAGVPGAGTGSLGIALRIPSGLFFAAIAFWFVMVSMLGGLMTLPLGWVTPDSATLLPLIFGGLFGGMAHIAMTLAFRHAEASRLAPFEYIALIWPVLADLFLFCLPLAPAFLFALPLVLGGAALAAMEPRKGKEQPNEVRT
jgi:drug/metabolite transporter (DMT)-like permease